jgi:hypothetical protein
MCFFVYIIKRGRGTPRRSHMSKAKRKVLKSRVIWVAEDLDGSLWGAWSFGKTAPKWLLGSRQVKFIEQLAEKKEGRND